MSEHARITDNIHDPEFVRQRAGLAVELMGFLDSRVHDCGCRPCYLRSLALKMESMARAMVGYISIEIAPEDQDRLVAAMCRDMLRDLATYRKEAPAPDLQQ